MDTAAELELAIRQLIAENEAVEDRTDRFGTFYEVKGVKRYQWHRFRSGYNLAT